MFNNLPEDFWDKLSPELSEARKNKILAVAGSRTNHITLVLQDVSSEHNICACLRSAEAFGIQNIHIVNENRNYKMSTVSKGSSSWLTIHNHKSVHETALSLKEQGYTLCAAVPPDKKTVISLSEIELKKPLALVFGNEHAGISKEWDQVIDLYFTIPMFGFVESLNISVSAAISMQSIADKCREKLDSKYFLLSEVERAELLNKWALKKIPHAKKKYGILST